MIKRAIKKKHCVVFIEAAKLLLRSGLKTSSLRWEAEGLCFSSPGLTSLGLEAEVQLKQEQEQVLRGLKANSAGADGVDLCSECSDRRKSESPVHYKRRTELKLQNSESLVLRTQKIPNPSPIILNSDLNTFPLGIAKNIFLYLGFKKQCKMHVNCLVNLRKRKAQTSSESELEESERASRWSSVSGWKK